MTDKKKRHGYILVHVEKHPKFNRPGFVREHREVVEKYICRPLRENEVIHHINQDKTDNRLENLMVFQSQAEHMAFHIKIKQHGLTNSMKKEIENRWNYLKLLDANPLLQVAV